MNGIKRLLVVLWVASCGGGGGGGVGPGGDDMPPGDANPGQDGNPMGDAGPDAPLVAATNDSCAQAIEIDMSKPHSNLAATTLSATANIAAPCGTAGMPDVFFKFTITRRELIYADTFGAGSPTTLYLADSCTTALTAATTSNDALCSTTACGTSQSQVAALLPPGTYYLMFAGQSIGATIHFQHAQVGTGSVSYLVQGSSAPTGTTSGIGLLNVCTAGGAENAYWWMTCPSDAGGMFTASTCTGTAFDTVLSFQRPGEDSVACSDDSCSTRSSVGASIPAGAGLYVLAVDGFSAAKHGAYTLTVSRP